MKTKFPLFSLWTLFFIAFFAVHAYPGGEPSLQEKAISQQSALSREEISTVLRAHNEARKKVGVSPLEWSDEIAAFAQEWAEYLASSGCNLKHRPHSGKWEQKYGENIFMGSNGYTVLDAVKSWESEKKFYKNEKLSASNWSKTGHYTQIVWSKSRRFGCGKAICKDGSIIIVGNYDPAGNMMGEKPY